MAYKPPKNQALTLWNKIGHTNFGRWVVSKGVCFIAPYFSTIKPVFTVMERGHVEITMKKRRAVHNHIKTVHAIAMCNAAELVGGFCIDISLNADYRWIPVGMEVKYLKMAKTDLRAVCKVESYDWEGAQEVIMPVSIFDTNGDEVFSAKISMKISPKPKK